VRPVTDIGAPSEGRHVSDPIPVFVNQRPVQAASGESVADVLRRFDPALAGDAQRGDVTLTDGVGRPLGLELQVVPGTIVRAVRRARAAGSDSG